MTRPMRWQRVGAFVLTTLVSACSPALDWREFVPEHSRIQVSFPCRPDQITREVMVASHQVAMRMLVCETNGVTYAIGFFDVEQSKQVPASLDALRAIALRNVEGHELLRVPWRIRSKVDSVPSNDHAIRVAIEGRRPNGTAVYEQAAFFAHGLRVYQAIAIGAVLPLPAIEPFFEGLRFPH